MLPCRPVSAAALARGAGEAAGGAATKPAERPKERRRRTPNSLRCPRATAAAGRDLVEVKASAKMQLAEKGRKWSSKQPSACDKRSVKNKALVAEVLDHVNLPSWSRRPSACDKRSGQRKEPVNEDLAQGTAADPWTRSRHGRRSWR